MAWIDHRALEGRHVRLEPLNLAHAEGLFRAAGGPDTFRYMLWTPDPWGPEGFEEWIRRRQADTFPFAVVWKESGETVGATTFLEVDETNKALEVGYTWYGPAWRGTVVNPEAKFLLLSEAFENLGAVRVQLKCDDRNERSKAGILKLGARPEGVLRNHRILPDGHRRATAYFSVLPEEWPDVRGKLVERIGSFGPTGH